MVNEVLF